MGATRSGVFVGSLSIRSQERRRFSWPRSKPSETLMGIKLTYWWSRLSISHQRVRAWEVALCRSSERRSEAEFTEGEAQLFRSKFPMCISQLASKFITWEAGNSLLLPSSMERNMDLIEGWDV